MGVIISKNQGGDAPEFEDGLYPFRFDGLSFKEKMFAEGPGFEGRGWDNGDRYVFAFTLFIDGEPLPVDVKVAKLSTHEKSTSYMLLKGLLSKVELATLTEGDGAQFDADDLVGRKGTATLEHNKNDWPKITAVVRAAKATKAAVAVESEDPE